MSKIFEAFGYPLDSKHEDAVKHRASALCPFMEAPCDGGGNRYLSAIDLKNHKELATHFPGLDTVQVGVCSLMVKGKPWIVCPRRLLALSSSNSTKLQERVRNDLLNFSGLTEDEPLKVWSEVKLKMSSQTADEKNKSFDYTFDYVIAGSRRRRLSEISKIVGKSPKTCRRIAEENGFTLTLRTGEIWVDDFPADPILIVEIMTSSTSGGNKANRTQIGMAFEDAILGKSEHNGPGINYRQVWARMVSQLIVKSQVSLAWGGKTIWVLQDVLTDYISETTDLNLHNFLNTVANEVNILALGYGDDAKPESSSGIILLSESSFFSGPVSNSNAKHDGAFIDIIKVGTTPPKDYLWRSLFLKSPCSFVAM